MAAASLDQDTLAALDQRVEVDMITPRRDGSLSRRPIWVVVMGDDAYVRSYRGESGAWYRRARADGRAALGVGGDTIEVAVEPVSDDETNGRVSEAFRAKYAARSPGPTETMVNDEVSRPTLRVARREVWRCRGAGARPGGGTGGARGPAAGVRRVT